MLLKKCREGGLQWDGDSQAVQPDWTWLTFMQLVSENRSTLVSVVQTSKAGLLVHVPWPCTHFLAGGSRRLVLVMAVGPSAMSRIR